MEWLNPSCKEIKCKGKVADQYAREDVIIHKMLELDED